MDDRLEDFNVVVLAGRAAASPELRDHEDGRSSARCLVTVRSERPRRRLDVVPVIWWEPDRRTLEAMRPGVGLWVAGRVERRLRQGGRGGGIRLEIVAHDVQLRGERRGADH